MKDFKEIKVQDIKSKIIDIKHKDSLVDVPLHAVVCFKNKLYIKIK